MAIWASTPTASTLTVPTYEEFLEQQSNNATPKHYNYMVKVRNPRNVKNRKMRAKLEALRGVSHLVNAQLVHNGHHVPAVASRPRTGPSPQVALHSLQCGTSLRLVATFPPNGKSQLHHKGNVDFPLGYLGVMQQDDRTQSETPKRAVIDPKIEYPDPADKTQAIFSFTSQYAIAKGLRPCYLNQSRKLSAAEREFVNQLENLCVSSAGQRVELRLTARKDDNGHSLDAIPQFEAEMAKLESTLAKHYLFPYRNESGSVDFRGNPLEMSAIIGKGNDWIIMEKTLYFAGPSHAEIVLGYGLHFAEVETKHAYAALGRNAHSVVPFRTRSLVVLALFWNNKEFYNLQDGDEIRVTIYLNVDNRNDRKILEVKTHVLANVFDVKAHAFLVVDDPDVRELSQLLVDYDTFVKNKCQRYSARLEAAPNLSVSKGLTDAVYEAFSPLESKPSQDRLLRMLLSQAHERKVVAHPLKNLLTDAELEQFHSDYQSFRDGDAPKFTESQKTACDHLLEPENGVVLIDGMGGSGKTFFMHEIVNFFARRSNPIKAVVSSQSNGVLDMNAVELHHKFGKDLRVIRIVSTAATGLHNLLHAKPETKPASSLPESRPESVMFSIISKIRNSFNRKRRVIGLSIEAHVDRLVFNDPKRPTVWGRFGNAGRWYEGVHYSLAESGLIDMAAYLRKYLPLVLNDINPQDPSTSDRASISNEEVSGNKTTAAKGPQPETGGPTEKTTTIDLSTTVKIGKAYYILCKCVVAQADVLVGTPYALRHNMCSDFSAHAKGVLVFVDEAPNLPESAALILFTLPKWAEDVVATVFLGDMNQLGPQDFSTGCNQFSEQMTVSLHERLLANNYRVTLFREQKRVHSAIFGPVNDLFYNGHLVTIATHPELPAGFTDVWLECIGANEDFRAKAHETAMLDTPRLTWFEVDGKVRTSTRKAKANLENIVVARDLVERLSNFFGDKTQENLAVITPYRRQKELYDGAIAKMMERDEAERSLAHYPDIWTIDQAQGNEKFMIILDLVVTNCGNVGFLQDKRRSTSAVTRGKQVLWIIGGRFDDEPRNSQFADPKHNPDRLLKTFKESLHPVHQIALISLANPVTNIPKDLKRVFY